MMKSILAASLIAVVGFSTAALAAPAREDKHGVLVVSFGTSMPEARKAIDNLVEAAKKAVPGTEVRLAYTSNIIRRKIAREQNLNIPTPLEALAAMNDQGFTHVRVMPTHIIPGEESDDLAGVVRAFASLKGKYGFKSLTLGQPFLNSVGDCDVLADVLIRRFEKVLAEKGTAVVLMGHGTPHHIANAMYSQLQLSLNRAAEDRFFIGTVEAAPELSDVIRGLKKAKPSKIILAPLMIVAGDHANNDMADPNDPESWLCQLKAAGFENVTPSLHGLGEDAGMAELFALHLKGAR